MTGIKHAKGRCFTCYVYFINHNKERSKQVYEKSNCCKNPNCQKPLGKKRNRTGGYCNACHKYYRRQHKNRPKEMCLGSDIIGWCDCGQPAKYKMEIKLGGKMEQKEIFILCKDCYE